MQVPGPHYSTGSLGSLPFYNDYIMPSSREPVISSETDESSYDQYYTDEEPKPKQGFGILNIFIHPISLAVKAAGGLITLLLS